MEAGRFSIISTFLILYQFHRFVGPWNGVRYPHRLNWWQLLYLYRCRLLNLQEILSQSVSTMIVKAIQTKLEATILSPISNLPSWRQKKWLKFTLHKKGWIVVGQAVALILPSLTISWIVLGLTNFLMKIKSLTYNLNCVHMLKPYHLRGNNANIIQWIVRKWVFLTITINSFLSIS